MESLRVWASSLQKLASGAHSGYRAVDHWPCPLRRKQTNKIIIQKPGVIMPAGPSNSQQVLSSFVLKSTPPSRYVKCLNMATMKYRHIFFM